jgi:(1->4)-alpha-D-glucan 1-alpha-D-glucosylmutase
VPLAVAGAKADHVVAFARNGASTSVLVVVPLLVGSLLNDVDPPPSGNEIWGDTHILLPPVGSSPTYRNVLTGEVLEVAEEVSVSKVLAGFPVALCVTA